MPDSTRERAGAVHGRAQPLSEERAREFAERVIFDPGRAIPIVAVTTSPRGQTLIDPDALAAELGENAGVVLIETGEATWVLTESLPPRFDVYGGCARIWWPGITKHDEPRDHPLIFMYTPMQGEKQARRIVALILGESTPTRDGDAQDAQPSAVLSAVVESIEGGRITLRSDVGVGELRFARLERDVLARSLCVGQEVPVRRAWGDGDEWSFSTRGLLPDPWTRVGEEYGVGDVVRGRVQAVKPFGAFVELLPGAVGLMHISEMDWTYVDDPRDHVSPGAFITVSIQYLEPTERRCDLSMKRAFGLAPLPPITLLAGGPAFDGSDAPGPSAASEAAGLEERIDELSNEVDALVEDRSRVMERNRKLTKELRSVRDQKEHLAKTFSSELDPLRDERAFLLGVRLAYARAFGESDRERYPLRKMRVGPKFLSKLGAMHGVSVEKVLDVCALVAAGRAHEVPAREVHELGESEGGAKGRMRARDHAKAWRCSLQDNTPSARRLHWWTIPGSPVETVEFASVGVHDDLEIPE